MPKLNREGQATTLTPAQLDQLLDAAPSPAHRCALAVMRHTGSRATETLRLAWGAVGGQELLFTASTTKTKRSRSVRLSETLQQELTAYRDWWAAQHGREPSRTDLLFPAAANSANQAHMTRQALDLALRTACKALGDAIPDGVSTHSLRRSFVTTAVNAGAPLNAVREYTGHTSLDQLQRYADVSDAARQQVIAAISGA
jgi:integrase/recombinase XerD